MEATTKPYCKGDYSVFKLELYRGRLYIRFGTKYRGLWVKPTKYYHKGKLR